MVVPFSHLLAGMSFLLMSTLFDTARGMPLEGLVVCGAVVTTSVIGEGQLEVVKFEVDLQALGKDLFIFHSYSCVSLLLYLHSDASFYHFIISVIFIRHLHFRWL